MALALAMGPLAYESAGRAAALRQMPGTEREGMENFLFVIGYMGTGLVIGAYAPQIWHLWTEQCSAGISERAYALWVLASALFLGHALIIEDVVFMVTQFVNIGALLVILVLARRFRNQICAEHAHQLHVRK